MTSITAPIEIYPHRKSARLVVKRRELACQELIDEQVLEKTEDENDIFAWALEISENFHIADFVANVAIKVAR